MILDYSIPNFTAAIGSDSITNYLDKLALQAPIPEMGQPLLWTGRFAVSRNVTAIAAGLDDDWFDPRTSPSRWRPGQKVFQVSIDGNPLPPMRIDRYAYNPETNRGEGTLVQLLQFYNFSRPALESSTTPGTYAIDGIQARPTGNTAADVIKWLIGVSFLAPKIPPLSGGPGLYTSPYTPPPSPIAPPAVNISLPSTTRFAGDLSTADPISDAQRQLGNYWNWLVEGAGETVTNLSGEPGRLPLLTIPGYEWEPDIEHLNTPAGVVVVTGNYKVLAPRDPCPPAKPTVPETDSQGRKTIEKTDEQQPAGVLFPQLGTDSTPLLARRRTTYYLYAGSGYPQGIPPEAIAESRFARPLPGQSEESPWQTITVIEQPAGVLFPQLGTNTTMRISSIEIQREEAKVKLEPIGVLFPQLGVNFNLVVSRREELKTTPYLPSGAKATDQVTGQQACLEPLVEAKRYPVAEVPLVSKQARGVAKIRPNGWIPVVDRIITLDIGEIAGPNVAQFVAEKVAFREEIRRDSIDAKMPIPSAWLAAGCPPMFRAAIGANEWLCEGPIISMDCETRIAQFGWKGRRLSTNGIPAAAQVIELTAILRVVARATVITSQEPLLARVGPSATIDITTPPAPVSTDYEVLIAIPIEATTSLVPPPPLREVLIGIPGASSNINPSNALVFDGVDDSITLRVGSNIASQLSAATIKAGFQLATGQTGLRIFWSEDTSAGVVFGVGYAAADTSIPNTLFFYTFTPGVGDRFSTIPFAFDTNSHELAVSYQVSGGGYSVTLHIDGGTLAGGSSVTVSQTVLPAAGVDQVRLGSSSNSGGSFWWKGLLANLQIWDYAFTPAQVAASKCQVITSAQPGLLLSYNFAEGIGHTGPLQTFGSLPISASPASGQQFTNTYTCT